MIEPKLERVTLILPVVDARPTRPAERSPGSDARSFGDHLQRAAQPAAHRQPQRSDAGESRGTRDAETGSTAAVSQPATHDSQRENKSPPEAEQAADSADSPPSPNGAPGEEAASNETSEQTEAPSTSAQTDHEKTDQENTESVGEIAVAVPVETAGIEDQQELERVSPLADDGATETDGAENEHDKPLVEKALRTATHSPGEEHNKSAARTLTSSAEPDADPDSDAAEARPRSTSPQSKSPETPVVEATSPRQPEVAQPTTEKPVAKHDSQPNADAAANGKATDGAASQVVVPPEKRRSANADVEKSEQTADAKRNEASGHAPRAAAHGAQATEPTPRPTEKKPSKRGMHESSHVEKDGLNSAPASQHEAPRAPAQTGSLADVSDPPAGEKTQVSGDSGGEPPESSNKATSENTPATELRSSRRIGLPLGRQTGQTTAESDGPNTVQRARFVQRVARAFNALGDRGGPLRLRLSPPELGSLRMEVTVRGGVVTAHIEAESQRARAMLLENLPALRERLAGQDIKIERFDVDLMDQSPDGLPQTPQEDRRAAQQERRAAANVKRTTQVTQDRPNDEPVGPSPAGDGQLNVVV